MDAKDEQLGALERALWESPDDDQSWQVYADLLDSQGDPTAGLIRSVLAHGWLSGPESLGPLHKIVRPRVEWKRREHFPQIRLWPLQFRGLHVSLKLQDRESQLAVADAIENRLQEIPRLLVFMQSLEIGMGETLTPELLAALRKVPFQQLTLEVVGRSTQKFGLEVFPAVQHLELRGIPLSEETGSELLPTLRSLEFNHTTRSLAFLTRLPSLERLAVDGHQKLALEELAGCPRLHTLSLDRQGSLERLAGLSLRHLRLISFREIDLRPLAKLHTLEGLEVSWTDEPVDLEPLSDLPNLQYVEFSHCKGDIDLRPLATLPSLKSLKLYEAWNARCLDVVTQARRKLEVDHYEDIRE